MKDSDAPHFVTRGKFATDDNYRQWLVELKQRYRQSQAKAAVRVNTSMLDFY